MNITLDTGHFYKYRPWRKKLLEMGLLLGSDERNIINLFWWISSIWWKHLDITSTSEMMF